MARVHFVEQLKSLGFSPTVDGEKVRFEYKIELGRFAPTIIQLGFVVGDDFPANAPTGPHLTPRLLPIYTGGDKLHEQGGGVHESTAFGADWQYWSRPYTQWNESGRTVREYLSHIRHLFETLK